MVLWWSGLAPGSNPSQSGISSFQPSQIPGRRELMIPGLKKKSIRLWKPVLISKEQGELWAGGTFLVSSRRRREKVESEQERKVGKEEREEKNQKREREEGLQPREENV